MMFHNPSILPRLAASTLFSDADLYQARFAASLAREGHADLVAGLTALVSMAVREGPVCLRLDDADVRKRLAALGLDGLEACLATGVIGTPGSGLPLVLDGDRLYFSRFFRDEEALARAFLGLAATPPRTIPTDLLTEIFKARGSEIDWQDVACLAALRSRFCVITGGPGTGKTTTVARILSLAARMHAGSDFRIRLAAPTGKAASRMTEALAGKLPAGSPPKPDANPAPEAQTVHRLLGWSAGGFRHRRDNPLPLDMLVVDEASMLDLELAARLVEALPEHAALVLLGDRNQLASVEAGAVLANLCREDAVNAFSPEFAAAASAAGAPRMPATDRPSLLTDHVVELRKSWRFGADSGIAALAAFIVTGEAERGAELLKEGRTDLKMLPCTGQSDLAALLKPLLRGAFRGLGASTDPATAFEIFGTLRLLSPVRKGPRGTEALNRLAREAVHGAADNEWYPGRPVMILENDYSVGLFNGDAGIALPVDGQLRVFFPGPKGFVSFSPSRLPRLETCYAMTVHKSQGSEFGHAVLVLPEEPSPVLGRELLYTALTRAKNRFTLVGTPEQVKEAVQNPARMDSGLGEMLAEA